MDLIKSPWADVFARFGRSVRNRAVLAAPFIGSGPLLDLAGFFNPAKPPQVELVTNLSVDSLFQGTVDSEAIAGFCRSLPEVEVRHLPGLHAKVYVADDHLAIITSGNLTQASLNRNYEYGVRITEKALVQQIAEDVREYASLGSRVTLIELDELTEITKSLHSKYAETLRTSRESARKEYQESIELTRAALMNLRAKPGETTHSIFARTILHVLKRGPLSTREMQPIIQAIHPDICDNSIDRVINGVHFGRKWKHMVRNSQLHLKRQGRIEFNQKKWRLTLSKLE
jgi:hypothetical protein